ncbi:PadR family transcriptional regulator [Corticibacter populi]|uniref:PadR family transcriptional regulator n=1 Tax=Corticibacter populi TaxID=1550736 RepID=A0A3M6QTR5_9BURK|nr:PadR family transcriptional regulator [Corticibacter populi]RMX05939.1 PadR family transcriptional regulator [Corticibacter populi]RZS30737.1 PadR family transcriptional regulator [Corticibacter populi]
MSLPHALLTALLEHPCSGLELSSRFERSIGHFWSATHQQIYRELARLEAAGWVSSTPAESGRGRKKIYTVLPAGKRELRRWLDQHEPPPVTRDPLMLRLRAAASVGPGNLAGQIEEHLALHRRQLAHYLALADRKPTRPLPARKQRIYAAILQSGIAQQRMWVECCEAALQAIAADDDATDAAGTTDAADASDAP